MTLLRYVEDQGDRWQKGIGHVLGLPISCPTGGERWTRPRIGRDVFQVGLSGFQNALHGPKASLSAVNPASCEPISSNSVQPSRVVQTAASIPGGMERELAADAYPTFPPGSYPLQPRGQRVSSGSNGRRIALAAGMSRAGGQVPPSVRACWAFVHRVFGCRAAVKVLSGNTARHAAS